MILHKRGEEDILLTHRLVEITKKIQIRVNLYLLRENVRLLCSFQCDLPSLYLFRSFLTHVYFFFSLCVKWEGGGASLAEEWKMRRSVNLPLIVIPLLFSSPLSSFSKKQTDTYCEGRKGLDWKGLFAILDSHRVTEFQRGGDRVN